jgi:geranylgeranyl reductase family protein
MSPARRFDAADVAIVGAGPAGSRAAWRLARAGARVVIFDGSHPREKPCGGGLTGRALDLVQDAIAAGGLAAVAIHDATFEYGAQSIAMPLARASGERPRLAVMSRRIFDEALLAAAVNAGARLIPARVRSLTPDAGGWMVAAGEHSVKADWLLGADGPNSFVRRSVQRPFPRQDLSIATGFYVHGCTSSRMAIAFEDEPAGYLWAFPRPDHLAVGVCAQADESSTPALQGIASRWIDRNVPAAARLEKYSWPIPSLRAASLRRERPSGPRWMLLGDAGGMVDPITREGIYFALVSADAAADSLEERGDSERTYAQRIRDGVHPELIRAATLKRQFFNSRFTTLLIEALGASGGIRDVMIDLIAGAQSYHGLRRRLMRTREWRLALRLLPRMF